MSYQNIEKATFNNVDIQSRFVVSRFFTTEFAYNFSQVDEKAEQDLTSGISPHSLTLILSLKIKDRLEFVQRDQFYGSRNVKVYDPNSKRYLDQRKEQDAYNLLNLTVNFGIWDTWKIRLGATNLLDHTDDLYGPYTGRRFFTTLEGSI